MNPRRRVVATALLATPSAWLAAPALASSRRALAGMTDGPFYPPRAWRDALRADWDADLTETRQPDGRTLRAQGEHLDLALAVVDVNGRIVDAADVEIWQCDALRHYHHPDTTARPGAHDPGFQGFGALRADARGRARLRTIRPVPYPGRTPHIHVKVRHPAFGEWTGQLFVAGDPGNERDFLWRHLAPADREPLAMRLLPLQPEREAGLRWRSEHRLVMPA